MEKSGFSKGGKDPKSLITVVCPSCGRAFKVKDPFEGKKVECPHCGFTGILKFIAPFGFELIPEDNVWILG